MTFLQLLEQHFLPDISKLIISHLTLDELLFISVSEENRTLIVQFNRNCSTKHIGEMHISLICIGTQIHIIFSNDNSYQNINELVSINRCRHVLRTALKSEYFCHCRL